VNNHVYGTQRAKIVPSSIPPSAAPGLTSETANPATTTGTAAIIPAIGPAAPMSRRTLLSMIGDFILMNAPKVPMKEARG